MPAGRSGSLPSSTMTEPREAEVDDALSERHWLSLAYVHVVTVLLEGRGSRACVTLTGPPPYPQSCVIAVLALALGLSSRNPADYSALVLCIKSSSFQFHLLGTAIFWCVWKYFYWFLEDFMQCVLVLTLALLPRWIPHPYPPSFLSLPLCPISTNVNFPSFPSLLSTDIAATISCTSHLHSVLQKRLINRLCLEIQENEHLTRRGERRRQRLMTSGVGLPGRLRLAPRLQFKATD